VGYSITPTSSPPRRLAYLGKIFPINRLALEDIIQSETKSGKREMPYRRSIRRKTWRNYRTARTGVAARTAAVAALRRVETRTMNSAVRGLALSQGEFKAVDFTVGLDATIAPSVRLLNGIARGDEITERTGRECTMRSIEFRGEVKSGTLQGVDQTIRVLIVYDRQTNATALTGSQVFVSAGDQFDVFRPRNLENRRRFKILFDRTYYCSGTAESASGRTFKFYRKLNHPITFNNGDAGTVADITTGSLYAICVGDQPPGDTAGHLVAFSRIRYTDN